MHWETTLGQEDTRTSYIRIKDVSTDHMGVESVAGGMQIGIIERGQ